MALRMPAQDEELEALPFSCSTNLSKDVHLYLRRVKLGGAAWEFCSLLHDHTFGDAGWHRKNGHRETWCAFDLASWARELECDKSNLQRVLRELEACQIIFFAPDANDPGKGRIGWNIHFSEWQRYDSRRARGRFTKDLQKQSNIVILPIARQGAGPAAEYTPDASDSSCSEEGLDLAISNAEAAPRKITMAACQNEPETAQNNYGGLLQITMAGSSEGQESAALAGTVIKVTEEEKKEDMVAGATQASFFPQEEPPSAPKEKTGKRSRAKGKQTKIEQLLERRPELRPLHEMAINLFGKPMGLPALNWADYIEQLGDRPVSAEQLQAASAWYKRKYPDLRHSLQAVTSHYQDYEKTTTPGGNGNARSMYQHAPSVPAYKQPTKGVQ